MKFNSALNSLRNCAIAGLLTSYLGHSFFRWNLNPQYWGAYGRGSFMWTYLLSVLIYAAIAIGIRLYVGEEDLVN